jgi:hypothetical protein
VILVNACTLFVKTKPANREHTNANTADNNDVDNDTFRIIAVKMLMRMLLLLTVILTLLLLLVMLMIMLMMFMLLTRKV